MTAPVISLTIQKEAPDMWYLKTEQHNFAIIDIVAKVNYKCIKSATEQKISKFPLAVVFVFSPIFCQFPTILLAKKYEFYQTL